MERCRLIPVLLAVLSIAAVGAVLKAQTVQDLSANSPKVKPLTEAVRPMLFSPVTADSHSIELRPTERMTQKDRDLAADAESSIGERAGFADLEFNEGKWSYRQLVCPALPNHLFLRFTRNNGAGDVSVFTASIPRQGEGHVRIIPIQRRGYSLFSPAPINALTIAAFNRIRAEEPPDTAPDWLGTGLCYAALAGANPEATPLVEGSEGQNFNAAPPAVLEISVRGGAVIRFTDESVAPRPMEWTLIFNANGRVLKVAHLPASLVRENGIQPAPVDARGTLLPYETGMSKDKPVADKPVAQASSASVAAPAN